MKFSRNFSISLYFYGISKGNNIDCATYNIHIFFEKKKLFNAIKMAFFISIANSTKVLQTIGLKFSRIENAYRVHKQQHNQSVSIPNKNWIEMTHTKKVRICEHRAREREKENAKLFYLLYLFILISQLTHWLRRTNAIRRLRCASLFVPWWLLPFCKRARWRVHDRRSSNV